MPKLTLIAEQYVTKRLSTGKCATLAFHNVEHTRQVVKQAFEIAKASDFTDEEIEITLVAAWFHDAGYCAGREGHEALGAQLVTDFLLENKAPKATAKTAADCIRATKTPQQPTSKFAKVLCDADLYHLGMPQFFERNKLLRAEWETDLDLHYSDADWLQLNITFVESHQFHTAYGQKKLQAGMQQNLAQLREKKQALSK